MPEQIVCPKCGVAIKRKAAAPAPAPKSAATASAGASSARAAAPAAPPEDELETAGAGNSQRNVLLLGGLLGGLLLAGIVMIVGISYFLSTRGDEKKDNNNNSQAALPGSSNNGSGNGNSTGGTTAPQNPFLKNPGKDPNENNPKEDPKIPPKDEGKSPENTPEIKQAIDLGVAHLRRKLMNKDARYYNEHGDDGQIGAAALGGLALLEAKVSPKDPAVVSVLERIRAGTPSFHLAYSLSTTLFFLNRLHQAQPLQPADRDLVRTLALRLIANQLDNGRWDYNNPPISAKAEQELWQKLATNQYRPTRRSDRSDNSITQFVILALWGCREQGIPVRPALLLATAAFQSSQLADGTWEYYAGTGANVDTATCAGLIALAMERTLREDKKFQGPHPENDPPANPISPLMQDKGFAHLAKVIERTSKEAPATGFPLRASAMGDCYFLWCVERVGVIYDRRNIDDWDWYNWGADILLKAQNKQEGSWNDRHGDFVDTCFAILFLTRANLAKDLTESIRSRKV
jgi:hypothetical protein